MSSLEATRLVEGGGRRSWGLRVVRSDPRGHNRTSEWRESVLPAGQEAAAGCSQYVQGKGKKLSTSWVRRERMFGSWQEEGRLAASSAHTLARASRNGVD